MNQNHRGTALIEEVMADMGLDFEPGPAALGGSSDIGNVSYQCAALHPKLRLVGDLKVCHSKEFAAAMLDPTLNKPLSMVLILLVVHCCAWLRLQIFYKRL